MENVTYECKITKKFYTQEWNVIILFMFHNPKAKALMYIFYFLEQLLYSIVIYILLLFNASYLLLQICILIKATEIINELLFLLMQLKSYRYYLGTKTHYT